MMDFLLFSAVLPLVGAGGIYLVSFLISHRDVKKRYLQIVVSTLALAIVVLGTGLVFENRTGRRLTLSALDPSLLTESMVELRWDAALWPLGLALSMSVACLLLSAGKADARSLRQVAFVLMLLASGLAALWSANPLTTIVCWAFYDFASVLGQIAFGASGRYLVQSLAFGTSASLLVWTGVWVAGGGIGSVPWGLIPPGGAKMSFWVLAGLLRLGGYPLHLAWPRDVRSRSPLIAAVHLGPVLGWGLWMRLAVVNGGVLPVAPWMATLALLTLIAGGLLAWTANSARESRPWIAMGGNGAVLLATVLASLSRAHQGSVVAIIALGAGGWILGTTLLFVAGGFNLRTMLRGKTLQRDVPSLIGALSLIGAPATAGFVGRSSLMRDLVHADRWVWTVGFLVGQIFLVAAVLRWLSACQQAAEEPAGLLSQVVYGVGVTGLTVSLAVLGVVPSRFLSGDGAFLTLSFRSLLVAPSLVGWLLWGGALLLGAALAWLDMSLRPRVALWLDMIHEGVRLDWAYEWLTGALEQGLGLLRVGHRVLSGRGALLWACSLLLVLILIRGL